MAIRFVYFDLGNVLLRFSVHRMLNQLATVAETSEADASELFFDEQKYRLYESGEISTEDFFQQICGGLDIDLTQEAFLDAINDIFWANDPILPIARKLAKLNFPRGILSNTNPAHWKYVETAFPRIWDCFPRHKIASFEAKALKPFPEIYAVALADARKEIPDLQPNEVLFIDDLEANVQGAVSFGFQAIWYVDFESFLEEYKKYDLPVPSRYLAQK